jgi:dihydroorotate dehydrogenase
MPEPSPRAIAPRPIAAADPLYRLARPLLFRQEAEDAHELTLRWASRVARSRILSAAVRALYAPRLDRRLEQRVFGLTFPSPIGLAAGLDKDGVAVDLWAALGFGFVEVGTVTPGAGQPGNDRPRLERIVEDRALVNRMGFNNRGAEGLAARLAQRRSRIPVGANLGKAKHTPNDRAVDDYLAGLRSVFAVVDYVTINVSSPNTPGLRDLQAVESLGPLLLRLVEENRALAQRHDSSARPLLLKISPDLADEDLDRIADLAERTGIDGLIATNTTVRTDLLSRPPSVQGGVSGPPLAARAHSCVERLYRRLDGRLPIVGVGGIENERDAYARLAAGASLVQIYTALIYRGPGLVRSLTHGLLAQLRGAGYSTLGEIIGCSSTPHNAN